MVSRDDWKDLFDRAALGDAGAVADFTEKHRALLTLGRTDSALQGEIDFVLRLMMKASSGLRRSVPRSLTE